MLFKKCLEQNPPRGYIKLLDRYGDSVSKMNYDRIQHQVTINHKNRHFYLKMDTTKSFNSWLSAFSALGLVINDVNTLKNNDHDQDNDNKEQMPSKSQSISQFGIITIMLYNIH